jgi:hypothetical protein
MMCEMTEQTERNTPSESEPDAAGVLANLPRTRPQRSSARRIAARDGADRDAATPRSNARGGEPQQASRTASSPAAKRGKGARKPGTASRQPPARAGSPQRTRARSAATPRARQGATSARESAKTNRAPRQGFESDADATTGPVAPPGGAELLNAATELLSEVAKSGFSRGASTVKDVLGRLRLR